MATEELEAQFGSISPFYGLSDEAKAALAEPLDPDRIKSRGGRGGGSFSYIETHDAVRTANTIFGYGQWGHEVVEQERLGEVPVSNSDSTRDGYHVGYRCVVRLTVAGCVPVSGTGYGDAVEYGGEASKITASELALKESESDALKRALKNFGDQFGLVLYAKESEAGPVREAREGTSGGERPITAKQLSYIENLIGDLDNAGLSIDGGRWFDYFHVRTPLADLTSRQASALIEMLKGPGDPADRDWEKVVGPRRDVPAEGEAPIV